MFSWQRISRFWCISGRVECGKRCILWRTVLHCHCGSQHMPSGPQSSCVIKIVVCIWSSLCAEIYRFQYFHIIIRINIHVFYSWTMWFVMVLSLWLGSFPSSWIISKVNFLLVYTNWDACDVALMRQLIAALHLIILLLGSISRVGNHLTFQFRYWMAIKKTFVSACVYD
jgi:hypothetical protein